MNSTAGFFTSNNLRNITIDDNDSSLKYTQGWETSSSGQALGGAFHIAGGSGDGFSVILPANVVAVYYSGFKQSQGATYGACIDCTANGTGDLHTVDAHDATTADDQAPTVLFSETGLDSTSRHTFAVINLPDTRFSGASRITVDSIVVTVLDSSSSTSLTLPMTSTATTSTSASAAPSTTAPSSIVMSAPATSGTDTSRNNSNVGFNNITSPHVFRIPRTTIIVGAIVASLFILAAIVFGLTMWINRRRRRSKRPFIQIQALQKGFLPPASSPPAGIAAEPEKGYPLLMTTQPIIAPPVGKLSLPGYHKPPYSPQAQPLGESRSRPLPIPGAVTDASITGDGPFTVAEIEARRLRSVHRDTASRDSLHSWGSNKSSWSPRSEHHNTPKTPFHMPAVTLPRRGETWELI